MRSSSQWRPWRCLGRPRPLNSALTALRSPKPNQTARKQTSYFNSSSDPQWRCSSHTSSACESQVVVLAGPTGVGKTEVSIALARRLYEATGRGAEVISADSVQVYQGLDVGSRKLCGLERARLERECSLPHHLIDVLSPREQYTAGDFYEQASKKCGEVLSRNRTPIVVGGTGFWLRWLVSGRPATPRSDKRARDRARSMIEQARHPGLGGAVGDDAEWARATALLRDAGDPETARRLNRNDYFRLERALEVVIRTGKPMRDHLAGGGNRGGNGLDLRCFFLHPPSRLGLYRKLDASCASMVEGGLLRECGDLLDLGLEPGTSTSTNAVGYRQFMEYLLLERGRFVAQEEGGARQPWDPSEADFLLAFLEFQKQTRRLAQDQLTWFRNEPKFEWVEVAAREGGGVEEAAGRILGRAMEAEAESGPREWDNRGKGYLTRAEERELKGYGGSAEGLVNAQTGELRQEIRDQIREQVVKVGGGVGPG